MFDTTEDKPKSERDLVSGHENNDYSIRIEYRTVTIHWLLVLVEVTAPQRYNLFGLVRFSISMGLYTTFNVYLRSCLPIIPG
jgi:hypothetical protein